MPRQSHLPAQPHQLPSFSQKPSQWARQTAGGLEDLIARFPACVATRREGSQARPAVSLACVTGTVSSKPVGGSAARLPCLPSIIGVGASPLWQMLKGLLLAIRHVNTFIYPARTL